jgi:hypothetical protein
MKSKIIKISLVLFLTASPLFMSNSFAGMGSMGMGLPCGGPFPPCPLPLNDGVYLLLIAGAAFGGKKIYDLAKKNPS